MRLGSSLKARDGFGKISSKTLTFLSVGYNYLVFLTISSVGYHMTTWDVQLGEAVHFLFVL